MKNDKKFQYEHRQQRRMANPTRNNKGTWYIWLRPKEMTKMISYKFRLYQNKQQISKLWQHANEMNRLYNYFLNQRMVAYKKDKINY